MFLLSHHHPKSGENPTSRIYFPGSRSCLQDQSSQRAFVPLYLGLQLECVPWGQHSWNSFRVAEWDMDADFWGREKLSFLWHLSLWDQAEKHLFRTLASPAADMPSCLCSTQVPATGCAEVRGTAVPGN